MADDGRTSGDGRFAVPDGTSLYFRWHRPAEERGRVVLVHGATEHAERYGHLVETLLSAGWSFYACDHRGHGRSEGLRAHVTDFSTYARDLEGFLEHIGPTDVPQVVYGHSMGGLVALEYAAGHPDDLDGLVLSGAAIRLSRPPGPWALRFGRIFATLLPLIPLRGVIARDGLSTDPAVLKAAKKDKLMTRGVTLRWAFEFLRAEKRAEGHARLVEVPTLVLQGCDDGIVDPEGAVDLAGWLPDEYVTLHTYAGAKHELHQEAPMYRLPVLGDVTGWLAGISPTD